MNSRACIFRILLCLVLPLSGATLHAADAADAMAEVKRIGAEIGRRCLAEGMLACEPNMRGIPALFDMIRARDGLLYTEQKFTEFMRKRYPEKPFEIGKMNATLDLDLNIEVTPQGMLHDPVSVMKVPGGYDATLKNGEVAHLRLDGQVWYLQMPDSYNEKAKKSFELYRAAAKLKSKILIYRMIEAELTSMDRETLEDKVCRDLAPLVAKVLGPAKVPPETIAQLEPLEEIAKFYGQFDSPDAMASYIRKEHHL